MSVFYLNSSVAAAFPVMLYGVGDSGGRAEELRNMGLHTCRKSCSGLGQDTTFRVYLHSRGSTKLLGRAPCVSLPYLMCLLLIFSAECVFGGEHQFLTLSTLLFRVVPFQTVGSFAIGLTGPGSDLDVFSSSSKTRHCRDLKAARMRSSGTWQCWECWTPWPWRGFSNLNQFRIQGLFEFLGIFYFTGSGVIDS